LFNNKKCKGELLKMERKMLINEIVNFCFGYKEFEETVKSNELKRNEKGLENCAFLEEIIGTIMDKTKRNKNIDIKKGKALFLAVDSIRWDLEFKDDKRMMDN